MVLKFPSYLCLQISTIIPACTRGGMSWTVVGGSEARGGDWAAPGLVPRLKPLFWHGCFKHGFLSDEGLCVGTDLPLERVSGNPRAQRVSLTRLSNV